MLDKHGDIRIQFRYPKNRESQMPDMQECIVDPKVSNIYRFGTLCQHRNSSGRKQAHAALGQITATICEELHRLRIFADV